MGLWGGEKRDKRDGILQVKEIKNGQKQNHQKTHLKNIKICYLQKLNRSTKHFKINKKLSKKLKEN